jgi:hypothetical protein
MLGLTTRSIWVVVRKLIHDSTIHIEDRGGVQTDKVKKHLAIPFGCDCIAVRAGIRLDVENIKYGNDDLW